MKFATRLVNYDASPGDLNRPMATPIYQTSTFEQEKADSFGAYDYSRSGNPTRRVWKIRWRRWKTVSRFCIFQRDGGSYNSGTTAASGR